MRWSWMNIKRKIDEKERKRIKFRVKIERVTMPLLRYVDISSADVFVQYWKLVEALSRLTLFHIVSHHDCVNWLQNLQHIDLNTPKKLLKLVRFARIDCLSLWDIINQLNCHMNSQNTTKSYIIRAINFSLNISSQMQHNG